MYLPKASISLNIAETTFILNAITRFVDNKDGEYTLSNDFMSSMFDLANDCRSLWDKDEWDVYEYMYHLNDFSQKWKVDRKAEWTISILDCDAIVLAMQYMYVCESKKAINGDEKAFRNANSIKDVLLPRFSDMFTEREWAYYSSEIDASNEDTIELRIGD